MATSTRSYRRLFAAYALASLGTGVAVVGLALLIFDLVRDEQEAAAVIGTALSIKAAVYVVGAPLAAALLGGLPRRPVMITLDALRAGALLLLPMVDEVWELHLLIAIFTLASAAFTPAYQAGVSSLLTDPEQYAKALSRSRLAGEFEGMASPLIAAALLAALPLRGVFVAAMAAFVLSAALIAQARLPAAAPRGAPLARLRRGFAALFSDPSLRGLAPLAFAAGAGVAVVMVETVPIVQGRFGRPPEEAALALAAFGAGSVAGALALPRLLRRLSASTLMLAGGAMTAAALGGAVAVGLLPTLLVLWAALGVGSALAQAPALALISAAVPADEKQTVYAAHFSFSTAAGGVCFAAAGGVAGAAALADATAAMAVVAAVATLAAALFWRLGGARRDRRPV